VNFEINGRKIGPEYPPLVVAEIGINHNGSLESAKSLISLAKRAGCDSVKFQKRTLDIVYTQAALDTPRESPWGTTTREQKEGLEFTHKDYLAIDQYCKEIGIDRRTTAVRRRCVFFDQKLNLGLSEVEVCDFSS
jgi:sialic acid synthase SpsE